MSSFTTPLIVEALEGGRRWKLIELFEYHVGEYPSENVIRVHAGFTTDFASVPRPFWPLISPYGKAGKAAVIHDYLYASFGLGARLTRKQADGIFLQAMGVLGVASWRRYPMYLAVRLFGRRWDERHNQPRGGADGVGSGC